MGQGGGTLTASCVLGRCLCDFVPYNCWTLKDHRLGDLNVHRFGGQLTKRGQPSSPQKKTHTLSPLPPPSPISRKGLLWTVNLIVHTAHSISSLQNVYDFMLKKDYSLQPADTVQTDTTIKCRDEFAQLSVRIFWIPVQSYQIQVFSCSLQREGQMEVTLSQMRKPEISLCGFPF